MTEDKKWIAICLHGYGVRSSFWQIFRDAASSFFYKVLCPNIDWSDFTDNQSQLVRLLTDLRQDTTNKIVLIGHSLGGVMAACIANKEPQLVDALFVISSPYSILEEKKVAQKSKMSLIELLFKLKLIPRWIIRKRFFSESVGKRFRADFFSQSVKENQIVRNLVTQRPWFHTGSFKQSLAMPSYFFASKTDKIVPWKQTEAFAHACYAKFILLDKKPNLGHNDIAVMPQAAKHLGQLVQEKLLIEKP